jgi:DnaJ-domain-containing protein 1
MEDGLVRIQRMQSRILQVIIEEVQQWLSDLLLGTFNPESFLQFVAGMGFDLSRIPGLVGQPGGFDPYRVLGLEKTATDGEIKKRYRELLVKLHPDTAGVAGTDFLLQMMIAAYEQIAKERRWQ